MDIGMAITMADFTKMANEIVPPGVEFDGFYVPQDSVHIFGWVQCPNGNMAKIVVPCVIDIIERPRIEIFAMLADKIVEAIKTEQERFPVKIEDGWISAWSSEKDSIWHQPTPLKQSQ